MAEVQDAAAESPEETYTFYHEVICMECLRWSRWNARQHVPVEKCAEDIPEPYRQKWIEAARRGQRLIWPMNVGPQEVLSTLRRAPMCPNAAHERTDFGKGMHRLHFLHAIGGGV